MLFNPFDAFKRRPKKPTNEVDWEPRSFLHSRVNLGGLVILAGVISALIWGAAKYYESIEQKHAEKEMLLTSLRDLARRHNALVNWKNELADSEKARISPLLTVELQVVWLSGKSIFFLGVLEDMSLIETSSKDGGSFRIKIRDFPFPGEVKMLSEDIGIEITCSMEMAAAYLADAKRNHLRANDVLRGIAAVARIATIERRQRKTKEGSTSSFIGIGTCEEIRYIPFMKLMNVDTFWN